MGELSPCKSTSRWATQVLLAERFQYRGVGSPYPKSFICLRNAALFVNSALDFADSFFSYIE